jgi:cysteine-rich repeat protein
MGAHLLNHARTRNRGVGRDALLLSLALLIVTARTASACDSATEVAFGGQCYYLDGSGGVCDPGYLLASQSILNSIAPLFAGKTYKHQVSLNCCIYNSDPLEDWGMLSHCNSAGPFASGEPALGGTGCTNAMNLFPGQLTLCTISEHCGDGVLDPGEECDDGNLLNGDGCSSLCHVEPCYTCSGQPSACSPLPDGSACDDGLFCNGTDICASSTCSVHSGDPCTGGTECQNSCDESLDSCISIAGTPCTDDGNVCTDDRCDGLGSCTHPNNSVGCDDGVFCNGADFCFGGSCSGHQGDPCRFSDCSTVCDEMTATCDPDAAGTPCFGDGNVCTLDQCDGAGTCAHPPGPSGVPCLDDGNVCTIDQCDTMGVCAHPPVAAGTACPDDGNECTHDACDGAGACAHPAVADGTACDDSNACTQTDTCHSGICVGADAVVCPTVPCHSPSTCDPTSGMCSNCPAGYTPGDGGCQRTYAIDVDLLDHLASSCNGDGVDWFACGAPFGFHWTDTGDASVGAVTRVDVQVNAGLNCSSEQHAVTLNTTPIGLYASTAAACTCFPPPSVVPHVLTDSAPTTYVKGGSNAVSIETVNCSGLSPDMDEHYAAVTVTYADLGAMVMMQSDCRQAEKSKFKYKNGVADAKDKLQWKWLRGATTVQADFADPTASADYQFCVYAETSAAPALLFGAAVPHGASAWTPIGTVGYRYLDPTASHDGMSEILVRGGAAGRSKIILRGKGAALSDPTLPSAPVDGIRIQLTNQSTGICWESELPASAIGGVITGSTP